MAVHVFDSLRSGYRFKCPFNSMAVTVYVLAVDLHLRAMTQHALDHGDHLGGGARLQLGVNASGVALDVPVDRDRAPAIPSVPLGHQVLVPGAEAAGIRGTRCRAFAPEVGQARLEGFVDHLCDSAAQMVWGQKATAGVQQVLVRHAVLARGDALEARIGAEGIQAKQEAVLDLGAVEMLARRRAVECLGKLHTEVGFFERIQQIGHRPASSDIGFQRQQIGRLDLSGKRRELDPAACLGEDLDVGVVRQACIEGGERLAQLVLEALDKGVGVQRQPESRVVVGAPSVEILGEILIGVTVAVSTLHPDLLAAQFFAQRLQDADLVAQAVDARPAERVALYHGIEPGAAHDLLGRHTLMRRVVLDLATEIALEQGERVDDWSVPLIVGTEAERIQQRCEHTPVVGAVSAPDACLYLVAVDWTGRLPLFDEVLQGLFAHHGEDNLFHDTVGLLQRGLREPE